MAEAIIGPLVGRLHDLAISEARALVAVNDDMQKLRDRLMWLQAFLRVADAKRRAVADEITKVWLHQTRDAVFDAEDALDHFYRKVDMSRFPWWARRIIACMATFTTQVRMRRVLSGKIKAINLRLEDIIQNKDKYKMEDPETDVYWKPSTAIQYSHRSKRDDIHQPNLPLHQKEKQKLLEALVPTEHELQKEDHRPMVISVYGKSGVGKTTLVRSVYKEVVKKNHFDIHAMESFAPNLTATNILHKIVQQLTKDYQNCPRSQAITMLTERLKDKKYFLVIDGEVSVTEWKSILTILTDLKGSSNGNRILHITQHKPFEPSTHHHVHVHLENLQEGDTIELFRSRLRHDAQEHGIQYVDLYRDCIYKILRKLRHDAQEHEIKDVGHYHDRIYKITEGLPLSTVLLAGLVQSKEFLHEWDSVFHYLESKKSKKLDNILSLCFDDLPHELRGCFLYFTAFPTNTTIEAHDLVCMWMAEGFLRAMNGKTMEKVGEIYMDELIARNLVNPVLMDDDSSSWSMLVTIQNKVHDFLVSEAHEASFLEVHGGDDSPTLTSARRLSLQNYTDKYTALARPLPKLRSIFSHFEQEPKEERVDMSKQEKKVLNKKKKQVRSHMQGLLSESEFLRVINLQGIEIGDTMSGAIDSVVHLQYLGVTSCSMKKIPRSIRRLTSLQTLDVRETKVRKLPQGFWEIMELRHVFGFALKLPKKVGNLKHLQTLDSIELDVDEQGLEETLGRMIHLENLFVWKIAPGNTESFSNAISKLEYLRNLALHGDNIPPSVFTSIALRRVKYMVLDGELKSYSNLDDIDSCLPNLAILSLEETKVSQHFISKLAKLPSLTTLALYTGSYVDDKLKFDVDGFYQLRKIKLDVQTLKKLTVKKGALNKLQELDILSELVRPEINAEEHILKKIV